jgi:hypothetical protein
MKFMRIENRWQRRVLQACGLVVAVFVVGLGVAYVSMMQRGTVQAASAWAQSATSKAQTQADPWTVSETVTPADLEKELSDPNPAKRPIVACVGFKFLYDGGHVPGASYHGPAAKPEGLADLKTWARSLPKSSNVVLYCGCCPQVRCPNLRPAFIALHDAGFARLRVLLLPTNFGTDWAAKGYPVEKGK